jgi:hypothetical protein
MPVFSSFAQNAYRAGLREAQDVLAACEAVECVSLEPARGFAFRDKWLTKLLYHDISKRIVTCNPGLTPVRLRKEYDLFIVVCPFWRDVWYANAIENWKDQCKTSICWIDELWAHQLGELDYWLPILNRFDHVFFGIDGTAQMVGRALGRQCHDMPGAVDALRFAPAHDQPSRSIDVYSVGRRMEPIHRAIGAVAKKHNLFYVYDTTKGGDSTVPDYRAHREMYAGMAKRSRFFTVAPGKADKADETGGQIDVGFRFFEGAAAGTVLVGEAPDSGLFRRLFDWPEAVVELRPDGSDVEDVFMDLLRNPQQMEVVSRRNSQEVLQRHDWIHRWVQIYQTAGVPPTSDMRARVATLEQRATLVATGRLVEGS